METTMGPVEYVVLAFPGNHFTGEVAPALSALTADGTIRIIDLVFLTKDVDGRVAMFEVEQLDELEAFMALDGEVGGILTTDDALHAAEALEPNSSAALLVWEDRWAKPLVDALRRADGVLVEGGRIPADLIDAAMTAATAAV
jgi:hypothetical protein